MNTPTLIHHLVELLAKSVLILGPMLILAALLRHRSAALRHTLLLAAFVALLLLPLGKFAAPHWRLSGLVAANPPPMQAPPVIMVTDILVPVGPAPEARPANFSWPEPARLTIGFWLAGAAMLLVFRAFGSWQIAMLKRSRTTAADSRLAGLAETVARELGCTTSPEVRFSAAARVPCTWGVRRAVVLLPAEAVQWSETHLVAALRHEFAHVARRDYLTRWLSSAVCALYWPNPLVWFAARQLHAAQEQACDDLVLRAGTPPADYATLLFETARACTGATVGWRNAIAMARPSTLENRVVAVVDETRDRRPAGRLTIWVNGLGVACVVGASALAQVAEVKPAEATAAQTAQVKISARFLEVAAGEFSAAQIVTAAEAIKSGVNPPVSGIDVLSAPHLTIRSGQRGMIQIGEERDLPLGAEPKKQFVGTRLEILPTVEDGKIQLQTTAEFTTVSGEDPATKRPILNQRKATANLTLANNGKAVLPPIPSDKPEREIFVFLEAEIAPPEVAQPRAGASKKNEAGTTETEAKFVEITQNNLKELSFDWLRGQANAGPEAKPAEPKATDAPEQSISGTRKPTTSVSVFDGQPVVLGELIREDAQKVEDGTPSIGEKPTAPATKPAAVPVSGDPARSEAKPVVPAEKSSGPAVKADAPGAWKLPIEIDAKNLSVVGGMAVGEGNVRFKYGTATITADSVRYNPTSHRAEFRGKVEIKTEGSTMRGETMSVEFAKDGRIFIGEAGDASAVFLSAYMSFQQGEQAEATGKIDTGMKDFNQSISLLDQVSQRWPTWNPEIVKHRRDRAAEALGKLQAKGSTGRADADPLNGAPLPIQTKSSISGRVLAYNSNWNFAVLSIGDQSGLKAGANMVVQRGNTMIAKLKVTAVKPTTAIADVVPDSMRDGKVEPGDTVISEGTR